MILTCGVTVVMLSAGLLGQIVFPATGITTKGQAMLLAIDDASLPLKRNLCYYLTKPTVHPEPVLLPSRDNPHAVDYLGCHFYGGVVHEGGKYRMWYYPVSLGRNPDISPEQKKASDFWTAQLWLGTVCYAESQDGIHWTKPNLGQLLFKGNRDNNALDMPDALIEGVHVIRDVEEPDTNRRYKMVMNVFLPGGMPTIRTATSADGIHWNAAKQTALGGDFIEESSIYRFNDLYFVNGQTFAVGNNGRRLGRSCYVRVSTDFDHWLPEPAESFVLPDPADAGKTVEHGRRDETHIGVGAAPFGNVLVGIYCIWHNDDDFGKISGDFGLVVSNDGVRFREPVKGYRWLTAQDSAVTPVPGQDYPTILCQGNGILNVGNETRIYHGRWRNVNYSRRDAKPEDYYAEVALATIPRDRWGALGLFPGQAEGSMWSCPMTLPEGGCDIVLNADGANGMRVEVADERFIPIADFSGDASGAAAAADGLDVAVRWPKGDLKMLGGKTVRLRVHVRKTGAVEPRLYAIYLSSRGR
ncbi:MAG: hypothetical protein HUU20_21315 [Pirellulales bacterium]|nr:hypothetical protein [Pirellulales bacterium]